MQVSVRTSDRVIVQFGSSLGASAGCAIEDVDDATTARIVTTAATRNGGIVLSADHATVTALPVPQATLDAEADAAGAASKQTETQTILEILQTTPIDPVALAANLAVCAAALGIPDPAPADLTALGTYLALPSPTAAQTAAATKALIRALGNYPGVVTAQRATISVLGDVIRYVLQRG